MASNDKLLLGDSIGQYTPDNWLTVSKTAKVIGCSIDTLKRWHKTGVYIPSGEMKMGKIRVWLYSPEDIENLKVVWRNTKPGRKTQPKEKKGKVNSEIKQSL